MLKAHKLQCTWQVPRNLSNAGRWLHHCSVVLDVVTITAWTSALPCFLQSSTEAAHADQLVASCEVNWLIDHFGAQVTMKVIVFNCWPCEVWVLPRVAIWTWKKTRWCFREKVAYSRLHTYGRWAANFAFFCPHFVFHICISHETLTTSCHRLYSTSEALQSKNQPLLIYSLVNYLHC